MGGGGGGGGTAAAAECAGAWIPAVCGNTEELADGGKYGTELCVS